MSQVQTFSSGGGAGIGILTINSNAADPSGNYTLNGSNGIIVTQFTYGSTIGTNSGAFSYNVVTGTSQAITAGNGYILTNAALVTLTLPSNASTSIGDTFRLMGLGAAGYQISLAANQQIRIGTQATTVGVAGSFVGHQYESIELTCVQTSPNCLWANFPGPQGNFVLS